MQVAVPVSMQISRYSVTLSTFERFRGISQRTVKIELVSGVAHIAGTECEGIRLRHHDKADRRADLFAPQCWSWYFGTNVRVIFDAADYCAS